jgi:cell pole-organizing protein PopZ
MAGKPEPTMEEILASIRRIIAEDDGERVRAPDAEPEIDDEDEPLDETGARFEAEPSAVLELSEAAQSAVSEAVQARASESFSALSSMRLRGDGTGPETLEGLVREMLQPMLKGWLDANLPEIVEQMVAREIARITRK